MLNIRASASVHDTANQMNEEGRTAYLVMGDGEPLEFGAPRTGSGCISAARTGRKQTGRALQIVACRWPGAPRRQTGTPPGG